LRAQLAEQSSTLLDAHPRIKELKAQISDLDRQIRDEAARLARSFENDARIAGARVESLQGSLDQLKQQAASTNGQDIELRALEREAKAQRDLLESYLAKYRETTARDSLGFAPTDTRVISRALVSNTPYFPKKLPIVLVATLAALFISAGFITTGELLAGNVYRAGTPVGPPAEPVPAVAEEPMPKRHEPAPKRRWLPKGFIRAKAADDPVKVEPVAAAEASSAPSGPAREITIDDLATALREAGEGGKRVAVVSAAPGNGAARTAVALARALAKDARVVVVDLALEHPELASITLDPRAPGIADLVRGTASFGQIITRDRISRVQIVPAGRVGTEAAMIFMSERLNIAMDALSRSYDHVVIDAGASPYVPADRIARLASCGVLVAGNVTEEAANATRDHLANAGFSDIALFRGTAPALDTESIGSVAA
jgi:polysaccharide biosynthesis transport protein